MGGLKLCYNLQTPFAAIGCLKWILSSHCNLLCFNFSLTFSWDVNICYNCILISCVKCFWDNNSPSSFVAKNRSKVTPLDRHPLVCYCINTVVFTDTQGSIMCQKTKEFNNIVDIVLQNTVKREESSTVLNAEEIMLSSILKKEEKSLIKTPQILLSGQVHSLVPWATSPHRGTQESWQAALLFGWVTVLNLERACGTPAPG